MAAETIKQISQGGVVRDIEDATARTLIQSLQNALDSLTNGDTTSAIESFNEIVSFLENVEDSSTLSGIIAGIQTSISGKVDKVSGKGLSTNDFTNELLTKLNGLSNYNDTALQTAVSNLQTALQNIYTKAQTYDKDEVDAAVSNKQDNISDLAEIRTNSKKGIANVSTPASPDGTAVITLANGDTFTLNLNHTHSQYITGTNVSAIVLCADEAAYNAITPDNNTLYLIPENNA